MTLEDIDPGGAVVSMRVRPDMVNGHGSCHGELIFALADSAFAFASNAHNRTSVARTCDITFVSPASEGDLLVASAAERHRTGRNGVYDVTVVRRDPGAAETVIAEFRGRSRELPGTLVNDTVTP